jgi:hypothetical protein
VAEVGDGVGAERALGFLDEEAVLMENVEDGAYMMKMVGPCGAVDEYIIEENQPNWRRNGRRMSFMRAWNVTGALHNPNGMTKNS